MPLARAYDPADGDVISRVGWFADVDNLLGHLFRGTDLHPRAQIGRRQLADRFSPTLVYTPLVPHIPRSTDLALGAFSSGVSTWLCPPDGSPYLVPLNPVVVPPGSQAWLVGIQSRVRQIELGSGGETPRLTIYKGSDVIGGGGQVHAVEDRWYYLGSDPVSAAPRPLVDIQNGEILYAGVDCTNGAGTDARVQGWDLWALYKYEHAR